MTEAIDTVVIGAGQAGLAMSWHLRERGCDHVVLERARVAQRWRSERWDSLRFQFPNWMIRLPGRAYNGADPDGFMRRDDVAAFIVEYAEATRAPVRCGVNVERLSVSPAGRFRINTDAGTLEARSVVVATGPYQVPSVPPFATALSRRVHQVTANRYSNPASLPEGGVLVVGSGASGYQIAEDLLRAGRHVWLSVGRHRRVPRRYRGRDFGWWQEQMRTGEITSDKLPDDFLPPLLTGIDGGRDADLRRLAIEGVRLVGSARDANDTRIALDDDVEALLAKGDEGVTAFIAAVDRYVEAQGIDVPPATIAPPLRFTASPIESLDLDDKGVRSIVWATGYRYDYRWIDCAVFDERGRPSQRRGVTGVRGLYFLGLPRLYKVKSSFLWGVGEDAEYLAEQICARKP